MRRLFTVTLAAALLSATTHHSLAQGELRPEVRYDVLRFQLDDAVKSNSHREILTLIRKMRATGIAPDGEIAYFEALANYALGKRTNAHRLLVRYLNTTGRKGKNYTKAIALFATIEREGRAAWVRKKKVAAAKRHWETVATTFAEEQAERRRWKEKVIVFDGRKNDIGRALARTATGGFMLAGSLHLTKGEGKDRIDSRLPWITTFDAEGRRRWHRPLGDRVKEGSLSSVVAIPGGGFLSDRRSGRRQGRNRQEFRRQALDYWLRPNQIRLRRDRPQTARRHRDLVRRRRDREEWKNVPPSRGGPRISEG
jgi:hypothetical protein